MLGRRLSAARDGEGSLVLIEAPAGTGKTALLRSLRAQAQGMRVLTAIGGELEREFAFGVVRQLFEAAVMPDRERWLSGAAALAAAVIGGEPVGAGGAETSFATLHGLYWLVAALAEEQPLLLVIDDAHWADAPSLRFVDFLARRVPELPVLVALGLRPREPGAEHALLAGLAAAPAVELVRPGALSVDAVRRVVHAGLQAGEDVIEAALDTTGGNPLLLRELVRTLAAAPTPPTAATVRAAVPSSVSRSVELRLLGLQPAPRAVARALAVLGDRADPELLAAVTGHDPLPALDALTAVDLVEDGQFVHPLVRAAVADGVGTAERHALHRRAAEALRERRGAEEDVIVHLLASPPLGEAWVRATLRAGARRALAEGAPDAALKRLRRAVDEPGTDDAELELELARAAVAANDPEAEALVDRAATLEDPLIAAPASSLQVVMGTVYAGAGLAGAADRLERAVSRLDPDADAELRDRFGGVLLSALLLDMRLAEQANRVLRELTPGAGPHVSAILAFQAACGDATRDEALVHMRACLDTRPFTSASVLENPTPLMAIITGHVIDEPALADQALSDAEATVQRNGLGYTRPFVAYIRAEYLLLFGSLALAEANAREAVDAWSSLNLDRNLTSALNTLIVALTWRGSLDEADAAARLVPSGQDDPAMYTAWNLWQARGELRLAQGRYADAVTELRRVQDAAIASGRRRWARLAPEAALIRALVGNGERDEALARAQAEVASARARGIATMEGEALIALGLARDGDLETFAAAVDVTARSPSTYLKARAAFEFGAALRRANQRADARRHLAAARDYAHRVDATALAHRAAEELTIAGGRPRRIALSGVEALTPSERRVAEHAARGLSNRDIAETLFVTRKTVEYQLGGAFSKLGIRSRTQLAGVLWPGVEVPAP